MTNYQRTQIERRAAGRVYRIGLFWQECLKAWHQAEKGK